MLPSRRVAAVVALLVAGLALSSLFAVHATEIDTTQVATEVSSADDSDAIASRVHAVLDAESLVNDDPPESRSAVETAFETGRYDGDDHPTELYVALDDTDYRYAVYEGSYYRWNATTGANDSSVTIRTEPVAAETALSELAVPYEQASPAAQRVVDGAEVEDDLVVEDRVVVDDGTYYVIGLENPGRTTLQLFATPFVLVLTSAGRAYLGVALGLLALLARRGDRPLDGRCGLLVAGLAVPTAWLVTATTESGSLLINYGVEPAFALAVALWLVAGVALRRKRYAALVGGGVGVGVLAIFLASVVGNPIVGVLTGVALLAAGPLGVVLVPYGYYLTPARDGDGESDGESAA
ncbi:hypothetical protein [Halorussus litoreus]|uniref:hypothetical protein n=1 Tax=Halorussus litoreus TaxID=1710536 RepID=UPI000E22D66F|nr:hypothetical protein [Halorussus litoreus]